MKQLILSLALMFSVLPAHAVEFRSSTGAYLGQANKIQVQPRITASVVNGVAILGSGVGYQVAASTTALTAAQCGSTVISAGAVVQPLPKGTTALLGCRYTFVTMNASNFDLNPDNADTIAALTNAAGDAIRNATVGNSVTLELVSATQWAAVAINGTYSDVN